MTANAKERLYLLLDSANQPLGQGKLESPPGSQILQLLILDDDIEEVARHDIIKLISMDSAEPPLQCRFLRSRGDRAALEKMMTLDPEVRRNLRVEVRFQSFLYPLEGHGIGRRPIQSVDLSCGGIAFYGAPGLNVGDRMEVVIPAMANPVILRCEVLRRQELRGDKVLYATKFVDMCEDEETLVREAVFGIQLQSRPRRSSRVSAD